MRHAAARNVTVSFVMEDERCEVRVADDGCGFDPGRAYDQGGLGLSSMAERASALEADLEITSGPGEGTTVTIRLPEGGDHDG